MYDSDYSVDSLRWLHKIMEMPHDDLRVLEDLQTEIIENNDSAFAYFFAAEFGKYKPHKMQSVILGKKDPKYAFIFAQTIPNADIRALQNVVMESKKIKYVTKFACFIRNADKKPLEDLIIKSKNVKYAHMYLKHVKTADVKKFKNIILESGKPRYLFELAKHLTVDSEITMVEDLIIKLKSFTYMRLFAEKIKKADVDKIEQAVLATDNGPEIQKFAKYVRKSKMKKFLLVM